MWKYTVEIGGMMCGMCESHINDAIRKEFPVKKVSSSHTKNRAVIQTEEELDEDKLRRVMDETGYHLGKITKETVEKRGLFGRKK
jgi:copper chaperone CopZ